MFETMVAIQRLRKSALRSGLHADCSVRGGVGAWEDADGEVFKASRGLFSVSPLQHRASHDFVHASSSANSST